jgi:electron transfer flavoprotein alpha/beta subunit
MQSPSFETSALMAMTSAVLLVHYAATISAASIEEEQVIRTFQPLEDKIFAVAAPTPLLPPVTIATGFFNI